MTKCLTKIAQSFENFADYFEKTALFKFKLLWQFFGQLLETIGQLLLRHLVTLIATTPTPTHLVKAILKKTNSLSGNKSEGLCTARVRLASWRHQPVAAKKIAESTLNVKLTT